MKLVLASNNAKKLGELSAMLEPLGFELVPQAALGVTEAEEPHCTFVENALAKARHAAHLTGLPALADDSGLCVPALGGEPGVHSARYAGEPKSDERNNARLQSELSQRVDRCAHYVAVLVFVRHAEDPQPIIVEGEWQGEIILEPRGNGGFGYDPLFLIPELGQTVAEMEASEKNRRSHRGQAMVKLVKKLQQLR